jgi:hypothetical protein
MGWYKLLTGSVAPATMKPPEPVSMTTPSGDGEKAVTNPVCAAARI